VGKLRGDARISADVLDTDAREDGHVVLQGYILEYGYCDGLDGCVGGRDDEADFLAGGEVGYVCSRHGAAGDSEREEYKDADKEV
jgi:hypothetical protein